MTLKKIMAWAILILFVAGAWIFGGEVAQAILIIAAFVVLFVWAIGTIIDWE